MDVTEAIGVAESSTVFKDVPDDADISVSEAIGVVESSNPAQAYQLHREPKTQSVQGVRITTPN